MNDAPRHHQLLVIVMASLLVAPPVWQAGQELVRMGDVYAIDLLRTVPTAGALRGFEAGLEERSWLVRWTRQSYGALVDRVFQRGNRLVVFGEDGWLFHRESVDFVTGPDFSRQRARRVFGMPNQPVDPLTTVVDFHRQLGAMGIELVWWWCRCLSRRRCIPNSCGRWFHRRRCRTTQVSVVSWPASVEAAFP